MTRSKTKSPTGFWQVDLARPVTVADFTYQPGVDHTVDDATLAAMRAQDAEAITSATAAA